ncbi:LysR substrate-binding domain-containing protein [Serratia oryzae]|uniref:LysR substrate-binding domain-containing protein n=1 Tax=Serratia oryzae TaxID=2034155 RepID=UPI0012F3B9E4|nr:LysR substrate-binding domain-containing protein [Serratia oryzae]VXD07351.1 conserved hypothetical protein [Enterobacterales bacterium 8AC]
MTRLPKIHQINIFLKIIEYGSIRAAAIELKQTQPGVTRAIKELEKTLGSPLFIRGSRGIVLTEMGRIFESRAQLIMKELERAVNELEIINGASQGAVTLGCSSLLPFTIMSSSIQRFQQRYPNVKVNINEGQVSELLPALREGELDFIIDAIAPDTTLSDITIEPFFKTSAHILINKRHPLASSTSLDDLKYANWCLPSSKIGYYDKLNSKLFFENDERPTAVVRSNTMLMALQMVLNEDYLTVGAKEMLKVPYFNKDLHPVSIKESLPDIDYSFIYSQRFPLTQIARKFINKLRYEYDDYQ